jgi:hypothetical protein
LCNTTEDFTWVFEHRKTNAEQFRAWFETESHNTTGDYKSTFFVNGLHATIVTWLNNAWVHSEEQMNEIVMREHRKLFVDSDKEGDLVQVDRNLL